MTAAYPVPDPVPPAWGVAGVALAACLAGTLNQFVFDDIHLVAENARIHDLARLPTLFTLPFWPPPYSQDLYRPLTSVVLATEWVIGGGSPLVFRLVSYLLYAAVAVGVYFLARRLVSPAAAAIPALLFAAHPVHVEAVALAVGQAELLVALFAVMMAIRYTDARRRGGPDRGDWGVLWLLYGAACLFKEQGLVLPALLLVLEPGLRTGAPRPTSRSVALGIGGFVVIAATALTVRRLVLGDVTGTFIAEALQGLSPGGRALTMLSVVPEWTRLLLWPAHLRADYSPQEFTASAGFGPAEATGAALLLGAVVVAWLARRRAPQVTAGLVWCGVGLHPVSNVIVPTGILLAERTLFLPSIGVVLVLGGLLSRIGTREGTGRALQAAVVVLVLLGVARSAERHRVFRNEGYFAARAVRDAPRSFRAHQGLGDALFAVNQPVLALQAYTRAIELAGRQGWRVRNDLARQYRERVEPEAELAQLRESLRLQPDQEEARGWAIAAELLLGRYEAAVADADSAIQRGYSPPVFAGLRALADSAARAQAPAGSVRIGLRTAPAPRRRPGQ